ncbi:MAG: DUF2207 domain-containing protein [Acidobacteria bacterium]|nr:MAG: DUF2207 domain-containing protein [Acidobacteriota bacterium]
MIRMAPPERNIVTSRLRLFVVLGILTLATSPVAADEGWIVERMRVDIEVRPDGSLQFNEQVDVDFRQLERHGIFRDLRYRLAYDASNVRQYGIELGRVTNGGAPTSVETTREGSLVRYRIGDPDRTISGRTSYQIGYAVANAFNGFSDHDELYWNVTGTWPVPIAATSVVVRLPEDGVQRAACFQGPAGSTEPCSARFTPREAVFGATRPLHEGEQMTIVVGMRRGIVPEPRPDLLPNPLFGSTLFDRTPGLLASSTLMLVGLLGGLGTLWWREGRDRRYVSQYYLTQSTEEETLPVFASETAGVEFEPPEKLRPAQMGVLLDERADIRDLTATIVDLAVRGYLRITELPKEGWFGSQDWRLDQLKEADDTLLAYERKVLEGLFAGASATEHSVIASRNLSSLKKKFYTHLEGIRKALYADAVKHRWFVRNPDSVRKAYFIAGAATAGISVWLTMVLGRAWGAGLIGLPIGLAGILLMVFSGAMPRRTAAGRDMMRRSLGFAKYIKTAETRQHEFAERANIFAEYLPFAIVFKCVDRWARTFRDITIPPSASGWYVGQGQGQFNASTFSSNLNSFSSTVSSAITSTPGGSGRSGFSGGSSGGGGGGGGGGSW